MRVPKGKVRISIQCVHQKQSPRELQLPGASTIYRLAKPSGWLPSLSVQPFADVICNYTCHDGKDKGENFVHACFHLPYAEVSAARAV